MKKEIQHETNFDSNMKSSCVFNLTNLEFTFICQLCNAAPFIRPQKIYVFSICWKLACHRLAIYYVYMDLLRLLIWHCKYTTIRSFHHFRESQELFQRIWEFIILKANRNNLKFMASWVKYFLETKKF